MKSPAQTRNSNTTETPQVVYCLCAEVPSPLERAESELSNAVSISTKKSEQKLRNVVASLQHEAAHSEDADAGLIYDREEDYMWKVESC